MNFHGIIYAYGSTPEMGELIRTRTAASMPFCGRYRLIDFSLSSMMNAGIHNVGVIMQRDYQSLLDHLGSGKDWDMGRRIGGLKMLPPFGLPEYHKGDYTGTIEALNAVKTYVQDIKEDNIVMMHGNLAANIDLDSVLRQHLESGAELTAICTESTPDYRHHRYIVEADGFARKMAFNQYDAGEGLASLEVYVISKKLLINLMGYCFTENKYHFHRDAIANYLENGGKVSIYIHKGYAKRIMSSASYFSTSMDILKPEVRSQLFPAQRPVRTKSEESVSTYYAESAVSKNSLVADGCIVEGELKNCVISSGVRIGRGASLTNCIVMEGNEISEGACLTNCIVDKDCVISANRILKGDPSLPYIIPKFSKL